MFLALLISLSLIYSLVLSTGSFYAGYVCAVLPAMMKPGNIAQNSFGFIENANPYFQLGASSWQCLSSWDTYTTLTVSKIQEQYQDPVWGALMAASFVTMASGA
jgi:hypothetical protein